MTKIKSNYDILYEKHKNKILFNIFPDIKNEEFIPLPNENNNNNNDTFKFIINTFLFIESNIYSIYKYLIKNLPSFNRTFYKIQYMFLITTLVFTFVYSLEDYPNITTNLIVSAYFRTCKHITYVSYDKIGKIEKKIQQNNKKKNVINKNNNIFIKDSISINNNNIIIKDKNIIFKDNLIFNDIKACDNLIRDDLKSLMSSNANKKNTYVNYENNYNNNLISKDEFYLFFIIPIKSCFFSFLSLLLLYFFIKITYTSKISTSFIFNIFCMFIIYNLTNDLYKNNYFLASSFMFILLIYLLKCIIDSVYLFFNYKKHDFEIFSTNLTAVNSKQFWLKFTILTIITITSGFMSICIYKLSLNYIIFYLCLLTYNVFLCNCLEPFAPAYLKPMKNLLMFIVGLLNFTVSKCYFSKNKSNSIFDINSDDMLLVEKEEEDFIIYESSLYFVSDLFSLFCFDYLREYIEYHFEDNFQFHKNLTKLDFIIISFFICSFGIGILGVLKNEYISFVLAIYIARLSLEYFIKILNTKISRLISHLVIIFYIFAQLKISSETDSFLIKFFSFTQIKSKLLSQIFFISSLLFLIAFGIKIYSFLYYSKENLNNDDLKGLPEEQVNKILEFTSNISKQKLKNLKIKIIHDNNNYKITNIFLISIDICLNYFEICIIFIILYERHNNFIMKILYLFLIILFISIKFFVVNDIKNNVEYLSIYFITFILSIRLLLLSKLSLTIVYFICNLDLLLLIISYSINDKKNKFISITMALYIFSQFPYLNSFFLSIDLIILIFFPIIKEYLLKKYNVVTKDIKNIKKGDKVKKSNLSLIFFLFILILFFFQLYGIHNYNKILKFLNLNLDNTNAENINSIFNKDKEGRQLVPIEYYIIYKIMTFLKIKK